MELKLISVCILGASLVLSACIKSESEISKTQNTNVVAENTINNENKVLAAYFAYSENIGDTSAMNIDAITSASLNGDTENKEENLQVMANEAAQINGGDVFSIKITEPYDSNYETMVGIAQRDQNENKHFDFLNDIENLDEYNVVYIGMPVWWGKLPQPMVSFFEKYDFSGKTIVPFGIHLGSHFGSMVKQIKELEPNAEIKDGFTVSADVNNEKVKTDFSAYILHSQIT